MDTKLETGFGHHFIGTLTFVNSNDVISSKVTVSFCASGAFASGLAEGVIEDVLQPICAIRLVFQSDADVWAILSEVCSAQCTCLFIPLG